MINVQHAIKTYQRSPSGENKNGPKYLDVNVGQSSNTNDSSKQSSQEFSRLLKQKMGAKR